MLLLPLPDRLGVFFVAEIVLVSRFGQPGALGSPLPGLLTFDLGTKALSLTMPVIWKKKSLAVRAFTAPLLSLHRFKIKPISLKKIQLKKAETPAGRKLRTAKKEEDFSVNLWKKTPKKKIHF